MHAHGSLLSRSEVLRQMTACRPLLPLIKRQADHSTEQYIGAEHMCAFSIPTPLEGLQPHVNVPLQAARHEPGGVPPSQPGAYLEVHD